MPFWSKKANAAQGTALERTLRAVMPGADEETVTIVAAVAGLLLQVAYEDRPYVEAEERRIREELGRVQGLAPEGVDAVCAILRQHAPTIATIEAREYARTLAERTDHDFRLALLDMLVDVAAADETISVVETNLIRRVADRLGLSQDDVSRSQDRHKDKLAALRASSERSFPTGRRSTKSARSRVCRGTGPRSILISSPRSSGTPS
jgi:uncharacterized tellurite resistance protein B-like protein